MSFVEELKRRNVIKVAVLYGVASWLLLQVADLLFDAFGVPDWSIRLLLAFIILGFPLTLILSWVYEMTPEGIKREKDIDRTQSITSQTGRKINILIVVLLVMAIAAVVVDRLIPETSGPREQPVAAATADKVTAPVTSNESVGAVASDKSIAVLPFANRSAREEDVFFVDGIHDDILTQLARIGSLIVISRTSVEKFKGTTQSMGEIGATLGVRNILEGGVQRAGDRVRINVQLIDVTTDEHLWADTYDRELTTANIFAIQSEISSAIAQALKATLSGDEAAQLETPQTENMAAMEAYFLGRQAMTKRTTASLADAERHFQNALDLDPNYALAYVGLANTYYLQSGYSGQPEKEALSKPLVEKALAINDRLGEAYIALAREGDDPENRETLYKKGTDLAPGYVEGHHWYGTFLTEQGRTKEALIELETAARLDPLSGIVKFSLGQALENLARFDEAREQYESALRIDPGFALGYHALGLLDWFVRNRLDEAMVHTRKAVDLDPGNPQYPSFMAILWSELGDRAEADRWANRARAISPDSPWEAFIRFLILLNSGDLAGAASHGEVALRGFETNELVLWVLAANDVRLDRADIAVERYLAAYPVFSDDDPSIDATNFDSVISFAFLMQTTGDPARANRLLDRVMVFIQTIPRLGFSGYGIADAVIYAIRGEKDRALVALREALDEGWGAGGRAALTFSPAFDGVRDEPQFQAIVAELEANTAAQLEIVRQMAADGELPPIPADAGRGN
jgi:TolB-like protein/cytochrome c-type biogenesis protein CcmH/NrfG